MDTSVIGGCCDPEFMEHSRAMVALFTSGHAVFLFSYLLAVELIRAPVAVQHWAVTIPTESIERIESSTEAENLRDAYVVAGVVGAASLMDAQHVALATVAGADMIVSWNFKHIVHHEKIAGFNAVNLREGYPPIRVFSPQEVV